MESRNENQNPLQNQQNQLRLLPDEIKILLCTFLDANGLFAMKQTSTEWYHRVTQDETKIDGKTLKERYDYAFKNHPLRRLLSHVTLGEWAASQIWEKDPSLLKCRGTVYHPNRIYNEKGNVLFDIPANQNPGRYKYVDCTAFQIALMNEEWEMAAEMMQHMDTDEVKKQFLEVFPDGKIVKYNWDSDEAKKRLEAVFNAVINDTSIRKNNLNIRGESTRYELDSMSESTRFALNDLYLCVKPASEHRTGLVFDANIYAEALNLYEKKFEDFKNNTQRSFWCIRVEEHLASLLPTGYLRPHARGMLNPPKDTDKDCTLPDGSPYYAFRRKDDSIPGFHLFIGIFGCAQVRGLRCAAEAGANGRAGEKFTRLCQVKREQGQILCGNIRQAKKTACLIS